MFEKRHQQVLPARRFALRLLKSLVVAVALVFLALAVGIAGYHWIVGLSWVDSLLNASMILTGMGQISELNSTRAKIFASSYALFSGLVFVSMTAVLMIPIAHRILHLFHHHKEDSINN